MIGWLVKGAFSIVVLAILTYTAFLVPLGHYTLVEHANRIAATPEAQDLGKELGEAKDRLETAVRENVARD